MSYKEGRLYSKYTITNNKTGKIEEDFTFVLIPSRDTHAIEALIVYAASVGKDNKQLAIDLLDKLKPMVIQDENLSLLHKVACSVLAISGVAMGELGN